MARVWLGCGVVATACLGLTAAGCGSARTAPVKGVVTFDNKPLPNAFVTFVAQDKGGHDAHGMTDASGAFQLSTFQPRDGALPGLYKVTVHYSEPAQAPGNVRSAEDVQKALVQAGPSKKPSVVLPPVYSQPDKTPFTHRVPDNGDARLELKSAPH
jgi:hypothetical protein